MPCALCPAHAFVDKNIATLRVMNKAAGRATTVVATVGESVAFEKLTIMVRACKQTDPFDAENFYSFVEISKPDAGQFFSGWMNKNEPGDNPVSDADYDVWLTKCE